MIRSIAIRLSMVFVFVAILALGAIGATANPAAAAADVTKSFDVSFSLFDPATGQNIDFTGDVMYVTKSAGNGLGDGVIIGSNISSLDGSYKLTYVQGSSLQIGSTLVQTIWVRYNIIGKGALANSQVQVTFHVTVTPTGQVIVGP